MDQEVRSEVLNFISCYIETSKDLEPFLLYKVFLFILLEYNLQWNNLKKRIE